MLIIFVTINCLIMQQNFIPIER